MLVLATCKSNYEETINASSSAKRLKLQQSVAVVCWLLVYLRDGSAQTIVCAATLR